MILFQSPYGLWLWFLPVILGAGYYLWSKRQLDRYCDRALQGRMLFRAWSWRSLPWLWFSLWSVLVLALAEPIWVSDQQRAAQQPIRWLAVVDVSESMLAEDVSPNRLQQVRWALEGLGHAWQAEDEAGLWVFAGSQHILIPQTKDQALWQSAIALLSPDILPVRGSLLIDTLNKVSTTIPSDTWMLVLTDGGDALDLSALNHLPQTGMLVTVGTNKGQYPVHQASLNALAQRLNWPVVSLADQGMSAIQAAVTEHRLQVAPSSVSLMNSGIALQPWLLGVGLMLWASFARWHRNPLRLLWQRLGR